MGTEALGGVHRGAPPQDVSGLVDRFVDKDMVLLAVERGAGRSHSPQTAGNRASARYRCGRSGAVASSVGRSRSRWRAVRTTLASTCWVSAPRRVRVPPQTFRMTTAGLPDDLSAPLAVTVMIATPAATGVTVICDPDTLTVATPGTDEDAW